MKKEYPCEHCGADMTIRESVSGAGFCFVCAPIYSLSHAKQRAEAQEEKEAAE